MKLRIKNLSNRMNRNPLDFGKFYAGTNIPKLYEWLALIYQNGTDGQFSTRRRKS